MIFLLVFSDSHKKTRTFACKMLHVNIPVLLPDRIPYRYVVCIISAFMAIHNIKADDKDNVFAQKIKLFTGKGTVYQLLKDVSEQSGYSFLYDSRIIENDKKITVKKGEYTLIDAIFAITGNNRLKVDLMGNHILLRLIDDNERITEIHQKESITTIILRGSIYDGETREPIPYVNVGITGTTTGSVSNQNGEFQLIIDYFADTS